MATLSVFLVYGVVYSQGGTFESYGADLGLARPVISCVYHDTRGALWVGTRGAGLYRFEQGRFIQQGILPDRCGYEVRQIAEGIAGHLLVLSEKGLFSYNGQSVEAIDTGNVLSVFATRSATWWLKGNTLVQKRPDGTIMRIDVRAYTLTPDPRGIADVVAVGKTLAAFERKGSLAWTSIVPDHFIYRGHDSADDLWFAHDDGTLLRYDGHRFDRFPSSLKEVREIVGGTLGSIWVAGAHGLSVFQSQDSAWVSLPLNIPVNSLHFDRQDRLWIGTEGRGLMRYFGEKFRSWPVPENEAVLGVLPGAIPESAMVVSPAGLRPLPLPLPVITPPGDCAGSYDVDVLSRTWALCNEDLWFWNTSQWIRMDSILQGATGFAGSDRSGNLWISAPGGLYQYGLKASAGITGFTFASRYLTGFPGDETILVLLDPEGVVWRIGARSISMLSRDSLIQVRQLQYTILSAYQDHSGLLWLGTAGSGIYYLNTLGEMDPRSLNVTSPVRTADIVFLLREGGQMIAGTDRSILRLHLDTATMRVTRTEVLNRDAGISLAGLRSEHFAITGDRHLLVATPEDILALNIVDPGAHGEKPGLSLRQVLAGGDDLIALGLTGPFYHTTTQVILPYQRNSLGFVLHGHSVESGPLLYQWRLSGRDTTWSAPTPVNAITFSGLPPGDYALEAQVCNSSGVCTSLQSPWRFTIQKAFWQRTGFIVGIVLLIFVLVGLSFRQHLARRSREKRRLEAELNALTLEQKALQLQMNPHFIFNALQTVKGQIHADRLEEARHNLTRFTRLMRTMLESSRSETVTLEEELEFLRAYIDVERLSHTRTMDIQFVGDEELDTFAIRIPPMLIQPVLENAIRYGGDEHGVRIGIVFTLRESILNVLVTDNGPGFEGKASPHRSASLQIIRARLERMGMQNPLLVRRKESLTQVELCIPAT